MNATGSPFKLQFSRFMVGWFYQVLRWIIIPRLSEMLVFGFVSLLSKLRFQTEDDFAMLLLFTHLRDERENRDDIGRLLFIRKSAEWTTRSGNTCDVIISICGVLMIWIVINFAWWIHEISKSCYIVRKKYRIHVISTPQIPITTSSHINHCTFSISRRKKKFLTERKTNYKIE